MGFIIRNISAGTVRIDDLGIELVNPNDEANLNQEAGQDIAISVDLPALVSASAIAVLDPLDDSTPLSIADGLEVISNANAPNYRIFGGTLTQLDDVDLTGITNGQALVWNSSTMVASPVVTTVNGSSGTINLDTTYASIAQGDVADTAVQPGDNISELINDSGYITLAQVPADAVDSVFGRTGIVIAQAGDYSAFYATAAQGTLADSAVQPGDDVSDLNNDANYTSIGDNISVFVNDAGYITSAQTGLNQLTGDVTAGPGNGSQVASIANSAVTNAKLRDSASLSVIGRTTNSVGIPGDIVAGTDGFVLRRSGSALTFGTVATAGISNSAITNAKLANVATGTLKGRVTAGTGAPTDLTAAQVRTLLNVADGASAAQNLWLNIAADTGGTATANTTTDTLTLAGGTGITTTRSGDTITINSSDAVISVDGRTGVVTLDDLYATFAQGATADTAVQPGDDVSDLNNDANYTSTGDNISVFVNDAGYITSAPVDSVFGRTGAVVAVDGDYNLTELGDVTITTPSSDQVLTYNGTTWVNATSSATAGPLPSLQIRRSTELNPLPTTWTDFAFDTVDLQNDTSVIEWDPSNTDRVLIKQDGLYEITYNGVADDEFDGRIRINDTTVIPGSLKEVGDKADVNQIQTQGSVAVLANLTAGDFLTFQVDTITDAEFMLAGTTMSVKKLQGTKGDKGDQGDPGVGSSILVEDEGVTVPNGPFTTLDFVGAGVTTTGAAGTATVTIPGGAAAKQVFMSHNGVGTQTIGGTYVTVQPGTVVRSDTIYSYSAGLVTINKTGWFHVEVENSYDGGNARMTSTTRLIRNGIQVPGTFGYGYHRNNSDGSSTTATSTVINITSGDTVGSQALGSSTMTTMANGCRLTITELDNPS